MFLAPRDGDSKSEASLDVDVKPKSEDEEEEEDDEPLIAAPLPKFINVPLSEQVETSLAVNKPASTLISTSAVSTEASTTDSIKPEQVTPTTISVPPKTPATTITEKVPSTAEKEINSVLDLEELLSDIEKNKTSNKVSAPLKAVSTQASYVSKVFTPSPRTITPSISHTPSQVPLHQFLFNIRFNS